jgi:hypothetical protein
MRIFSWNVLYRQYEEKYNPGSCILKNYPVESKRAENIVHVVKQYCKDKNVICLQECSEEILNLLLENIIDYKVFYSSFSCKDYIITIAPKDYDVEVSVEYPVCRGIVVIKNTNYRIANCHFIPNRILTTCVFSYVKNMPKNRINIVAGDFNEKYNIVKRILKKHRVPWFGNTYKSKQIDHIVIDREKRFNTTLLDSNGLSDHKPILLDFI